MANKTELQLFFFSKSGLKIMVYLKPSFLERDSVSSFRNSCPCPETTTKSLKPRLVSDSRECSIIDFPPKSIRVLVFLFVRGRSRLASPAARNRSEEHTSELQS